MRTRLVLALSIGLLTGCGAQDAPEPGERSATQAPPTSAAPVPSDDGSVELAGSPTIEEIKRRGKLMVGLRSDDPRFAMRGSTGQPAGSEYSGFDVEIAKILAEGIGLNPQTQITYRWLPPSLVVDGVLGESVDVQIGGFDPSTPAIEKVGPYAVVDGTEHFVGIRTGDDAMRTQLQGILDAAVADGRWQRVYDSTLGASGVQATPG